MIKSRLTYFILLGCVFAFMVFLRDPFSAMVFYLIVSLPFLSLAYFVFACVLQTITHTPAQAECACGDAFTYTMSVKKRLFLPVMPVQVSIRYIDGPFIACVRRTVGVKSGQGTTLSQTMHCSRRGDYMLGTAAVKTVDMLGLFSWTRPQTPAVSLSVLPVPASADMLLSVFSPDAASVTRRPGLQPAGDRVDIDHYHPGDRLRAIHWKLSSRMQEGYAVRRPEQEAGVSVLIAAELRTVPGLPDAWDEALASQALGLYGALHAAGQSCALLWYDARTENVRTLHTGEADLYTARRLFGTAPLHDRGPALSELLGRADIPGVLFALSPRVDEALAGTLLSLRYGTAPDCRLILSCPVPADAQDRVDRLRAEGIPVFTMADTSASNVIDV